MTGQATPTVDDIEQTLLEIAKLNNNLADMDNAMRRASTPYWLGFGIFWIGAVIFFCSIPTLFATGKLGLGFWIVVFGTFCFFVGTKFRGDISRQKESIISEIRLTQAHLEAQKLKFSLEEKAAQ